MMKSVYILYLLTVFYLGYRSSFGTRNPVFTFCLIVWILAEPVLNSREFTISIPGVFFDFHLNRIFTPVFLILILHELRKGKRGKSDVLRLPLKHPHEYFISIYLLTILISTALNTITGNISLKQFVLIGSGQTYFLLIYICTKMFLDHVATKRIINILLAFSAFSAFLALIQVFVERNFFWFGMDRLAFGEVYRALGIFHNEYTLAFFHITIIIFLLTRSKKHIALIFLNAIPVALSFHRLSWVILVVAIFYSILLQPKKASILIPASFFSIFLFLSLVYIQGFSGVTFADISDTVFYRQRLTQDTLRGRFDQWQNALTIMQSHFFGIGSYESDSYLRAAARIGQLQDIEIFDMDIRQVVGTKKTGLIVHNGFLSAGVKYGIPGAITFFLMCILFFHYHLTNYRRKRSQQNALFLLCTFTWLVYQTTQDFSNLLSYHSIFFAIVLALHPKNLLDLRLSSPSSPNDH